MPVAASAATTSGSRWPDSSEAAARSATRARTSSLSSTSGARVVVMAAPSFFCASRGEEHVDGGLEVVDEATPARVVRPLLLGEAHLDGGPQVDVGLAR